MNRTLLVFLPGDDSHIGLYLPDLDNYWQLIPVSRDHKENSIINAVNEVLRQADKTVQEVTAIGIYPGPAPYAQLRAHITTANTLAWVLGIPIFAFSQDDQLPETLISRLAEGKVGKIVLPNYQTEIL